MHDLEADARPGHVHKRAKVKTNDISPIHSDRSKKASFDELNRVIVGEIAKKPKDLSLKSLKKYEQQPVERVSSN